MVKERREVRLEEADRNESERRKSKSELCQIVAKTRNELYRRRQQRKATKKEKEIIKKLRVLIDKDTTNYNLRNAREQWLDKLRYER